MKTTQNLWVVLYWPQEICLYFWENKLTQRHIRALRPNLRECLVRNWPHHRHFQSPAQSRQVGVRYLMLRCGCRKTVGCDLVVRWTRSKQQLWSKLHGVRDIASIKDAWYDALNCMPFENVVNIRWWVRTPLVTFLNCSCHLDCILKNLSKACTGPVSWKRRSIITLSSSEFQCTCSRQHAQISVPIKAWWWYKLQPAVQGWFPDRCQNSAS